MESKELDSYFINPGELIISQTPLIIKTVLGSCVAVCIHDKRNTVGAMCHYLLPLCPEKSLASTKYGDIAISLMITKMVKRYYCKVNDLQGYIIGGAFVIFDEKQIFFVGERNVEIAKKMLEKYKIPIIFSDILGEKGRKVIFNTSSGEIKVSKLDHITLDNLYEK